jgi:hypothetical protein
MYYLKYAYGDFQPVSAFALRFGMAPTAFTDKYDGPTGWGYRFVQSSPVDRAKWESSADLGLAIFGAFPQGYGDYYAMFRNGEGYKEAEVNQGKAGQLRFSVAPLAAFEAVKSAQVTLAYKYDVDQIKQSGTPRILTELGDVLLTFPVAIADGFGLNFGGGFDWVQTTTDDGNVSTVVVGNIYHGYLAVDFPYHLGVFGRFDRVDPDAKNDKKTHGYQDEQTYIVGGISVRPIKNAAFALDYQTTRYTEQATDDKGKDVDKPADSYVYLNTEFKF